MLLLSSHLLVVLLLELQLLLDVLNVRVYQLEGLHLFGQLIVR